VHGAGVGEEDGLRVRLLGFGDDAEDAGGVDGGFLDAVDAVVVAGCGLRVRGAVVR